MSTPDPNKPAPLPALREDLDLYPGARTTEGAPTWVLHDPLRSRFFNVGWVEFELLRRWKMYPSAKELVARVNGETALRTSEAHVQALIQFLHQNELLRDESPQAIGRMMARANAAKNNRGRTWLHNYLFFRIPLFRPDRFLTAALPYVRFIYTRRFATFVGLVGLVGLYLVTRQWDTFTRSFSYLFSLEGAALFGLAVFISKTVHELGHAFTCKYFGLRVPTMGLAFLVLWPVLYTDTSESWKLVSRRQRMAIGAAGVISELGLAVFATLAWSFLPDGPVRSTVFFMAAVSWIITVGVNVNPFMRWDGYYLLSDMLGVQNLQERAFAVARWWVRERLFGFDDPPPERFPDRTQRILLIYAIGTWIYRLFLFLGIALVVYTLLFKLLGIILAAVEVIFFIGRPVFNEVRMWWRKRGQMRWNLQSVRTVAVTVALLAVVLLPWSSTITAPALARPAQYARVYTPLPGRLAEVHAVSGQKVHAGDLLFVLDSPELDHQLQLADIHVRALRVQLARQSSQDTALERRQVLEQQFQEASAQYTGLAAQRQQLRIVAPIDGELVDLADDLTPGRWMRPDTLLTLVINRADAGIVAYVHEADIERLASGDSRGRFYAENDLAQPFGVVVRGVDQANTELLDEPYNASVYGGGVPVARVDQTKLVPHEAVYRVALAPGEARAAPAQFTRGTVNLHADTRSLAYRAWLTVSGVVIREAGF